MTTEPARILPGPGEQDAGSQPREAGHRMAGVRHGRPARAGELTIVPPRARTAAGAPSRTPVHVAAALGISAGIYAVSLAGVTSLQAATNAQLATDRAPAAEAVAKLKATHDALDAGLARLDTAYAGAASSYSAITRQISDHEQALARLGTQVKMAEGSASSLAVPSVPTISRLPAVSTQTTYVSSKPVVNACTTASGKPC